ncbi:hypothetical protein CLV90_2857 [Maribacter spongiicola]|uniref:Uncharacterized protein n=1 Tax=Maribacter spongiicola TaxID=1206753 RepID=A0A4R7K0C4_9FLAO|nr:hypothetical protein [Maribacter spongiicola]TDT43734.1 hypothetical protein CLV90_2857 [Maribacter spongiicola]
MKFIYIKRESTTKELYRTRNGLKKSKVTSITKYFMGIPVKTLHTYRQIYYGRKNNAIEKMLFI